MTAKDVLKMAKEKGARIIDLRFIDLPGLWQHFSIPVSELREDIFEDGLGFDGSSIRGFQEIHASDMLLMPDEKTAFLDPFTRHKTLVLICDVRDPITKEYYARDPRGVAVVILTFFTRGTPIKDARLAGDGSQTVHTATTKRAGEETRCTLNQPSEATSEGRVRSTKTAPSSAHAAAQRMPSSTPTRGTNQKAHTRVPIAEPRC